MCKHLNALNQKAKRIEQKTGDKIEIILENF